MTCQGSSVELCPCSCLQFQLVVRPSTIQSRTTPPSPRLTISCPHNGAKSPDLICENFLMNVPLFLKSQPTSCLVELGAALQELHPVVTYRLAVATVRVATLQSGRRKGERAHCKRSNWETSHPYARRDSRRACRCLSLHDDCHYSRSSARIYSKGTNLWWWRMGSPKRW